MRVITEKQYSALYRFLSTIQEDEASQRVRDLADYFIVSLEQSFELETMGYMGPDELGILEDEGNGWFTGNKTDTDTHTLYAIKGTEE